METKLRRFARRYLVQAPRGWFLKLTRANNAKMRSRIAGKKIAIVGNAQSLLAKSYGVEIDRNDLVLRLNKGFVVNAAAQGSRTDFVGLTPELSEAETIAQFSPDVLLMLIPKMRHYHFWEARNVGRTLFYPFRYWFADRQMIGRRPSSGFMAISWLVRLNAADTITLYGFDFGATATYYNPEGYQTPHNYAKEAVIVRRWAEEGRITIVP